MAKKFIVNLDKEEKDDQIETILSTLAQSQPPDWRVRWTLQLLADRLVALTRLESLSYEAVRLMFLQPLAGWRHLKVTDQRTKQDFAWCMGVSRSPMPGINSGNCIR